MPLAIALLTGAKASNLPLCLMWLVAVAPLWRCFRERWVATGLIAVLALLVSFVPTAVLNIKYVGSWSGLQLERPGIEMKNPLVGLWGNPLVLAVNNFCPPVFPLAKWWNEHALEYVPAVVREPLTRNFEPGFQEVLEIPTEDWSGIGPGLSILMLLAAGYAAVFYFCGASGHWKRTALPPLVLKMVLLAPWIGLAAYCAKSGMVTPGRLSKARALLQRHAALLRQIEACYGVPGSVLVAIWGLESFFGTRRGNVPVVSALSTLAYEGRRAEFFEGQLTAALKILQAGDDWMRAWIWRQVAFWQEPNFLARIHDDACMPPSTYQNERQMHHGTAGRSLKRFIIKRESIGTLARISAIISLACPLP